MTIGKSNIVPVTIMMGDQVIETTSMPRAIMPGIRERLVCGEAWLKCRRDMSLETVWLNLSSCDYVEQISEHNWKVVQHGRTFWAADEHIPRLCSYIEWWEENLPTLDDVMSEER